MKVLVLNQYASAPKYSSGAGERHYFLGNQFIHKGIQTTIISAGYNHLFHHNPIFESKEKYLKETIKDVDFIWIKIKRYSALSGFGRVFSWFEFLYRLFTLKDVPRPDVVVVSSMSLLPAIYAVYLKRKFKIPFILEIRDIWPLTFQELGNKSKYHPLVIFLKIVENYAYRHSNVLVSVLPGFDAYISKYFFKLDKNVYWIPNGISPNLMEVEEFSSTDTSSIHCSVFKVVYAGALGIANHIIFLMKAANLLKSNPNIEFHILGDGYEKESLIKYKVKHDLRNVHFHDKIPKEKVNSFIKKANICYHGCKNSYLYSYGISPNKLNDYMLASKPILSASGLENDPVRIAECGFIVEPESPQDIANGILKMKSLSKADLDTMGENGYNFIMSNQTYEVLSNKYLSLFSDLDLIK